MLTAVRSFLRTVLLCVFGGGYMKKSRKIWILILSVIAVVCGSVVVHYYWKQYQNQKVYEEMQKELTKKKPVKKEPEKVVEDFEIPIDFASLQQKNPDIYAWIQIEGTNVNYPIVQSPEDDAYYLMRTVDRQEGYPGSIYTEKCNSKDFKDFNTLIYGHDMADGSMFQNLHNYSDPAYMKEHPYVVIYTPNQMLTYQIFAAVVYDDRHIMNTFDFRFDDERTRFLQSLQESRNMGNVIDSNITVNQENRMITMSTCMTGQDDKRLLVGAVLIDEKEK